MLQATRSPSTVENKLSRTDQESDGYQGSERLELKAVGMFKFIPTFHLSGWGRTKDEAFQPPNAELKKKSGREVCGF